MKQVWKKILCLALVVGMMACFAACNDSSDTSSSTDSTPPSSDTSKNPDSEYLDEAMRFQVFRYLSKPIDKQRFFRNMKDAVELYNTITIKIPVETKQGIHTLPASAVIAVEAQARKVIVHTTLCDFESVHNMQYWLKELPKNCFFQTHRSFIINFEHVTDFDHSLVNMADNQIHAYLTKRKYSAFKEAYLLYLESTR